MVNLKTFFIRKSRNLSMSIYNVDPEYSVSALNSSVPPSIMPSMAQRPIAGTSSSLVSIVSQSATQYAGGLVQINIPNTPNSYIKSGSAFLKMLVTLTNTGAVGSSGAGTVTAGNAQQNWSSLILRATMSAGANVLEQINQYSQYDALLNLHAGSAGYFQGNMKELYGQQITFSNSDASASTYSFTVCIPISWGLLNSSEEQHFPLGLLNSGLQLAFDLQGDLNQAIYVPAGITGVTSVTYQVANISFNYESIKVPVEHFQSLRQQMAGDGSLYQLPYVSALNMSIGASNTTDITFGIGLSSLKGVFSTLCPASAFGTQFVSNRYGLTQWRVLLDGQMINQFSLPQITGTANSEVEFFVELNRALGHLGSVTRTVGPASFTSAIAAKSGTAQTNSAYYANYFWTGLGCNKFCEHGLTYTGTPCSQMQVHGETISATAVTMFIVCIYDSCLNNKGAKKRTRKGSLVGQKRMFCKTAY